MIRVVLLKEEECGLVCYHSSSKSITFVFTVDNLYVLKKNVSDYCLNNMVYQKSLESLVDEVGIGHFQMIHIQLYHA